MYNKRLYVFDGQRPRAAHIRNYSEADFPALIQVQRECFPPPFPSELWWKEQQLRHHITIFPEGALCVEVEGEIAGSMTTCIVQFDPAHPAHTWAEMTDNGYIRTHQPDGDTLYVVDISVRPRYRKLGLGKWLMLSMYDLVIHRNLKRLLGGGRMPGYHRHATNMSAEEYLAAVLRGDLQDPVLTFLLRCGRLPVAVVPDYLEDAESCNYAVLMEWRNPFQTPDREE
ncbi:MAG: GNAT family N-acetyltransferase [Alicyclobacillus macrosporangiidus]|uniref:GNAT family N-acetyltransferase n=1 Tax=Alicyclobacillus macrosporangiidus TaxID=392015 RepID=UPI0026EFEDFD|nr:GNAT family N-acetyltransferase [Alicyclobacillus macrosporangiidus]MCL6600710.1 GNAT family N-acetyltransferase [Alicyclobacillus macrosporangiidus]